MSDQNPDHKIDYTGTVGGLMPIVLMNLLLTIITFGIYRFWAKTNLRRYYWSQTRFDGEPFEYTGTGGELFVGFLIVFFVFLLPLSLGLGFLSVSYPAAAPAMIILLYPFFIFLMGVALYRAQVYRMSRTLWRRIRGAQMPGSKAYGWLTLKYAVLYLITFGLNAPYVICRMWNFLMSNKRMGSGVMSCAVSSKPLFKVWVLNWLAGLIVFGGIIILLTYAATAQNIALIFVSYLLFFIASAVIFVWFEAAMLNHLIGGLKYQDMEFEFHITPVELLKFSIMNALILIFTLGLGAPFIGQRWSRLMCDKLSFTGRIDFSQISQSPESGPHFGEGLVEAFDIG